ncbi:MAG: class II aldolase/adducin family protein [Acidaminococcus sp.]|jgi:ribulose-5-phosphate 4-epimerase/fuculose-1-phosphate aldolase|nr:class II aldolase/adducin family protein [Acidaminococcus sp.]MCI2099509.1 class II aldolase/adducin family protein [Acidaminococcus sp.]MCI2113870.1 class II aldolase/adducin family protein [Acidaminococcus sp.]MCI2115557.1 class II aldolase/adducin family protein [Acidaminococcus sp.]
MDINDLLVISHYAGMREDLAQAGGGNSSVKINDHEMLIKASGCQMGEMRADYGWSSVDYAMLAYFMKGHVGQAVPAEEASKIIAKALIEGKRPSIETFLHAVTDAVTLHTHPTFVNVLLSRKGGMETMQALFPGAVFVGYGTPGYPLAAMFYEVLRDADVQGKFPLVFLKNHGLIVSGKTTDEVIRRTEETEKRAADYLKADYVPYQNASAFYNAFRKWNDGPVGKLISVSTDAVICKAARRFADTGWPVAISPDGLTYCGRTILVMGDTLSRDKITAFEAKYGTPAVILYQGCAYIVGETMHRIKDIEANLRQSAEIALLSEEGTVEALTREEQDEILYGSAGKYKNGK